MVLSSSFGSFVRHLQIKLSTYGSNLISIFVLTSELEFFLLIGVLTQNFNTMDLANFSSKKSKTSHLDCSGYIEDAIMQNHGKKEEVKNQDSMGKTNFFFSTLPFSRWTVSATWLHVKAH
jgi:hypothetical protein